MNRHCTGLLTLPLLLTYAAVWLPAQGSSGISSSAGTSSSMDVLIAEGHYLRARPLVDAALARNANDTHALVQRSVLEWAFFHFDDAIRTAEKAVALNDKSGEPHTQLTNALGAKLANSSAGTLEKMGMARRFRKEAELSVQLDPNSIDALEDLARYYDVAPSIVGGDKAKARELVERVVKLDPARGAALKAGYFADEKDQAKRDAALVGLWKAAVSARPESAEAHEGLAAVYFNEGPARYSLAESESRRAIALKPFQIAGYRQLAVLYATEGKWDELEAILKRARVAVPDDLSPHYQAARVILTENVTPQLSRAERYLREYLDKPAEGEEPSHAGAHWRLGLILEKLGRKDEAIRELQAAVREDGTLEGARKDLKRLN